METRADAWYHSTVWLPLWPNKHPQAFSNFRQASVYFVLKFALQTSTATLVVTRGACLDHCDTKTPNVTLKVTAPRGTDLGIETGLQSAGSYGGEHNKLRERFFFLNKKTLLLFTFLL